MRFSRVGSYEAAGSTPFRQFLSNESSICVCTGEKPLSLSPLLLLLPRKDLRSLGGSARARVGPQRPRSKRGLALAHHVACAGQATCCSTLQEGVIGRTAPKQRPLVFRPESRSLPVLTRQIMHHHPPKSSNSSCSVNPGRHLFNDGPLGAAREVPIQG